MNLLRLFVGIVGVLVCGAGGAQDWIGVAGVGVAVRDEGGLPISGAAVVLVPEFGADGAAPPFVFTDGTGRVEVFNLAAGEWTIEIRAAGFMIFNGYLKLEAGTAPSIGFSSRQRTGTFWQPLEVRFFEVGVDEPLMVGVTDNVRKEEKKRQAKLRQLAKQDEKALQRAEKRRQRRTTQGAEVATLRPREEEPTEVASTPPADPRAAELAPQRTDSGVTPPVRAVETPEPVPLEPRVTPRRPPVPPLSDPEPPRPAELEPSVDEDRRATPPVFPPIRRTEATPEPIEGTPIQVAEVVVPAEPAADVPQRTVPSIQDHPVLFRGGACPECKPGEWSLVIEREATAAATQAACGEELGDLVAELLSIGFAGAEAFAGPVADMWGNELPRSIWDRTSSSLASSLRPRQGSCQDFVAVLPEGARFIGFRFEAQDDSGRSDCFGEDPCAIGQARWTNNPQVERSGSVTLVHASFANESAARARRGRLTLYFRPLRGWQPPGSIATRSAPNRRR